MPPLCYPGFRRGKEENPGRQRGTKEENPGRTCVSSEVSEDIVTFFGGHHHIVERTAHRPAYICLTGHRQKGFSPGLPGSVDPENPSFAATGKANKFNNQLKPAPMSRTNRNDRFFKMEKTKVLILGAGGQIARHVIPFLQKNEKISLSLFLRNVNPLKGIKSPSVKIIAGDVLDHDQLDHAIKGQDIVYANLAGRVDKMAKQIVSSMEANGVRRLIFVASLGIYDEVPGAFGKWNHSMIGPSLITYRKAADTIETSDLDYTIVRPAWLTDANEVAYELTHKGEPFRGTEVSRKSVAAFIADLIGHPEREIRSSVGVDKPGTEGDKPAFY
jgi:hypothetical protein